MILPEAEILEKWLDHLGTDLQRPIDVVAGVGFQLVTMEGSEIVTKRIEPEEFYLNADSS